eukprot:13124979-Alexandrium_andersonii.AAC.1
MSGIGFSRTSSNDSAALGDLWFREARAAILLHGGGTPAYEHGFRARRALTWSEERSALDESGISESARNLEVAPQKRARARAATLRGRARAHPQH